MYHKGMQARYCEFSPGGRLKKQIACFWTMRGNNNAGQYVLPDGCIDIILNFGSPLLCEIGGRKFEQKMPSFCIGAMTHSMSVRTSGETDLFGVRFLPGMATSFMRMPANELTNLSVELSALWGKQTRELEQKMHDAACGAERIHLIETALLSRTESTETQPHYLAEAVRLLSTERKTVRETAHAVGIGERQLRRQIDLHTGLNPKLLARVLRFQRAATLMQTGTDTLAASIEAGYYDQAHLLHDFSSFCGKPPSAVFPA